MRYFILLVALSLSFLGCGHSQDMNEASGKSSVAKAKKKKAKRGQRNRSGTKASTQASDELDSDESEDEIEDDDGKYPNVELETEEDARILLVGIWRMDGRSLPPSEDILRLPKEQQADALAEERSRAALVAREFAEDGTYKLFLGGQSKQVGRYEILSAKHNVLEVEISSTGALGSLTETLSIEVNSKELKVTDDESRSFKMQRPSAGFGR